MHPNVTTPGEIAAWGEAASQALESEDLVRARSLYLRVAKASPADERAWINYGAVCGELGEEKEAIRALRRALRIKPDSREALSNLSVAMREAGRLDESEALCRRVITLDPEFAFGRYNLGHTLFLAGRFAEARDAYREGLAIDPERTPNQHARLAWALLANGQVSEAEHELRTALERIAPENAEALAAEADDVLTGIAAAMPERADDAAGFQALVRGWSERRQYP